MDFVDITDDVQGCLDESGIRAGQVTVFSPQPNCAIVVNELESGLLTDIRSAADRLGASRPQDRRTMIGSASVVFPAVDGKLRLGTWQRVLLVELEGPSTRSILVQIVGEQ
jgi:secondary thiamine-phosphate synthase enzyme